MNRAAAAAPGRSLASLALLALSLGARPAGAATLTRGPYLQLVDEASILVAWGTAEPADTSVEHGPTAAYGQRDSDPGKVTSHALLLTDLDPGTLYHYRILSDGAPLSEDRTFRTSPGFLTPYAPFRFIALGDTGVGGQPQLDVAAQVALSAPDFGLHVGDLVYPTLTAAELDRKYFQVYAETLSRAAVYTALGNKDVEVDDGALLLDTFHLPENSPRPERYYSFIYGSALFVALDTNPDPAGWHDQLAWLESRLAGSDRLWKIVFFHHAIYSSAAGEANREDLAPILDRNGVDLVIQGHNHFYERTYPIKDGQNVSAIDEPNYTDPGGPIYIVTGGGGGTLGVATPNSHSARYASVYEHVRVDIDGNRLALAAIDLQGNPIDSMTITKLDAPPQGVNDLVAHPGDRKMDLEWGPNFEADLQGYDVYRADSSGGFYQKVNTVLLAENRFTDTGLENGHEYCYVVAAVDRLGQHGTPSQSDCAVAGGEPFAGFKRADTDGNGQVDLTDAVALLGYLFLGTEAPPCMDAADADDDNTLSLTDAVFSLSWQFLGGKEPPPPGPFACGIDSNDPEFGTCNYPGSSCQ